MHTSFSEPSLQVIDMFRKGTRPVVLDLHDLSYHRTYGATTSYVPGKFTIDSGRCNFNQNQANPPYNEVPYAFGCTGFTQADNLTDQFGAIVSPEVLYKETCAYEGHATNSGCQVRNSFKITQAEQLEFPTAPEAPEKRGCKYFNIYEDGDTDWYDGVINAVWNQKVGASVATPWFASWSGVGRDGELPMPTQFELDWVRNDPLSYPLWHNYAVKGQEGGAAQVKAWLGYFVYMPRPVMNTVLEIRGSAAFIQTKYAPADLFTIKLSTWDVILHKYLQMLRFN